MALLYRQDPWGAWRDNVHIGMLCAMVFNALRGKDTKAVTFEDFMLLDKVTAEEKQQTKKIERNRMALDWMSAVAKPKKGKRK
jgi:hypothetical protein